MPQMSKRTLLTTLSALYLLALTLLSIHALHRAQTLSLPLPNILCALAIALPPLAGIALEITLHTHTSQTNQTASSPHRPETRTRTAALLGVLAFFLVYETALVALAGTYIAPQKCLFDKRWQDLWDAEDGSTLKRIQTTGQCCGLTNPSDRAWQPCNHPIGCLGPWTKRERKTAAVVLMTPIFVLLWETLTLYSHFLISPSPYPSNLSFLPSTIRLPPEDDENASSTTRIGGPLRSHLVNDSLAISDQGRVSEGIGGEVDDDDSLREEVDRLNKDSNLASRVEGVRTKPSPLRRENNVWEEGEVPGAL